MIKKIIKVKNCPSFVDFTPSGDLSDFNKFNLIYGWNGTGKTSLSRIFRSFETGKCYYDNANSPEFELELSDNSIVGCNDLSTFNKIRVFNRDFIAENITFDSGVKPIFYLGKDSKEANEKISRLETELDALKLGKKTNDTLFNKATEGRDKFLSSRAREIRECLTTPGSNDYRNYERPQLEGAIKDYKTQVQTHELTDDQFVSLKKAITQVSKKEIDHVVSPNLDVSDLIVRVKEALNTPVKSRLIESLSKDAILGKWVEQGLSIHKSRDLTNCSFCGEPLTQERLTELENHFNDQYQNTLNLVNSLIAEAENRKITFDEYPDSSNFYEDLSIKYVKVIEGAESTIKEFNSALSTVLKSLLEKSGNPFGKPVLAELKIPDTTYFKQINETIEINNRKTIDFENKIRRDKKRIEEHLLGRCIPEYDSLVVDCIGFQDAEQVIGDKIKQKTAEIKRIKEALISYQKPVQRINNDLENFLGRKDISLRAIDELNGYEIIRNGSIAKDLSEGEKTALAIVYFLAKINEDGFDLSKSVVVIDDPISSLDSSAIFQAFSFIKEAIKDADQVFVLTHHFDLFRLVKKWFSYGPNKRLSSFYMTTCSNVSGCRNSCLIEVDKLLIKYESEYHFLFSILYRLVKGNEHDLEKLYPIPNIARKFLESFLAFKIPIVGRYGEPDLYQRLREISFDEVKKTRINRFVDTHSHPRYESGVQDFDMTLLGEAEDVVKDILTLVEHEDPKHYNILVKSVVNQ